MLKSQELDRLHDVLAVLDEDDPVYQALSQLLHEALAEASEFATHPDTPEDKRSGWAGRVRGLHDFWKEFEEIHSGAYRQWPGYAPPES